MNTIKAEVNKIILGLISVGLVLLMLPVSLSAHHFRYGTMSWEYPWDNGTILLKMQNGWSANHNMFRSSTDYSQSSGRWISGYIGSIKNDLESIDWGDGSTDSKFDIKILSRDNVTSTNYNCTASGGNVCIQSTISEMGVWDNSTGGEIWTLGLTHTYPDNGTIEYVVSWSDSSRASVENSNGSAWRNETKVNIGGPYDNNTSPVSAVPPVIQVQDNTIFTYQVGATEANSDTLTYRWGKLNEFFQTDGSGSTATFTKPTGMELSSSGLITWDVRDSVLCSGCSQNDVNDADDFWVAVIMVEDRHDNGSIKSYVPVDFFFKTREASNAPADFTQIPSGTQTVSVGSTKTFTIKSTDDSGVAPTISVLNPPSDNSSIWSTSSSTSGGETTFSIIFAPDSSMGGTSYVVNIRSTDNDNMTKDQSLSIKVSTDSNAAPTAPILQSPANGENVTSPVTFRYTGSTDSDGDTVSYRMYICTNSGFVGSGLCTGTSVTAGVNFVPPFNQNFHDNLISWPSPLYAATSSQQISQDLSMIPKLFIMLGVLGLLSVFISFSVKNITHRRIVFMLFLIIIGTAVSCSTSSDNTLGESASDDDETYTNSDLTSGTTYYWKVVASDIKGGSAESETWSFTVQ